MKRIGLTVLACAMAGGMVLPVPALAECFNQTIGQVYLPMALKRAPASAHVMASVMTDKGLFEARASREADGNSPVTFFLDGKELKPVPSSELRRETLKCSRKRSSLGLSERIHAALSAVGRSIISEAEARYISRYNCGGVGTVTIKLVECWSTSSGSSCSYRFIQGGRTCGWAIWSS